MLSDESSSDSETGRFKGRSEKQDQQNKTSSQRDKNVRSSGRDRHSEHDRFHRDSNRRRDERGRYDRLPRERHRSSKNSPTRRRHSNDRSPDRKRSRERHFPRRMSRERSKTKEHRSSSRDRRHPSRSTSHRPPEQKRDIKEEIKRNLTTREEKNTQLSTKPKSVDKFDRGTRARDSSSPEVKVKKSEIHKPTPMERKKKSESPEVLDKDCDSNHSEDVQPGSYYSMKPTVIKEKSDGTSEIDSSDDEKLRAKLLNLEKELHQAKKKKHKKKHRKKGKSSKEEKDNETPTSIEVSSTTDIKNKLTTNSSIDVDTTEVTSTQKSNQVESNEEGEILSEDDSHSGIDIDPTDLRHKLKRSVVKVEPVELIDLGGKVSSKTDVCGPALPPHLAQQSSRYASSNTEGPALPPHLRKGDRKIGPSIPDQLRKKLAENDCEVIKCESSDDDGIGPLPAGAEHKWSDAHRHLEERALDMKIRNMDGHSMQSSKVKSREQWMLELPEGKAKYMGLEARTFRAKEGPDMSNRSSWTDTPEERARKKDGLEKEEDPDVVLQREARARQLASRDEEQEKAVKKHKKKHKREESLLEMHEKKIKKKKKKCDKEEKQERRPFSRDVDLQVNRFDEAQKKSVIKKAQLLDSRFSRGEAKYL
ncbi:serine/arginine repetitive matrix protein 5 [Leguminivora glycinivorella]|uniref:serine/arginine repetitive matrix protein 5 n=1 Tax=Leguminivora glycinivorella TaxID=1035111 RepID=UPI00200D5E98|nr:serine/arginine repetitive matrix protein 5 [Leguminivora glycinivorella]